MAKHVEQFIYLPNVRIQYIPLLYNLNYSQTASIAFGHVLHVYRAHIQLEWFQLWFWRNRFVRGIRIGTHKPTHIFLYQPITFIPPENCPHQKPTEFVSFLHHSNEYMLLVKITPVYVPSFASRIKYTNSYACWAIGRFKIDKIVIYWFVELLIADWVDWTSQLDANCILEERRHPQIIVFGHFAMCVPFSLGNWLPNDWYIYSHYKCTTF